MNFVPFIWKKSSNLTNSQNSGIWDQFAIFGHFGSKTLGHNFSLDEDTQVVEGLLER